MSGLQRETLDQVGAGRESDALLDLLHKEVKLKTDQEKSEVDRAVQTLAGLALKDVTAISDNAFVTIRQLVAGLDALLTAQVNEILHNADFQKLEGAWLGLKYIVDNTETSTKMQISVMNVSKMELRSEFKKYSGKVWDQSTLFRTIYEGGYGVYGGDPMGCIVADYSFGPGGIDVEVLAGLGKICASAHSPLIAGADPAMFARQKWSEILPMRDLALQMASQGPKQAEWNALRDSEDSRYITLAMPRVLARKPYGEDNPVDEFAFTEAVAGGDVSKFTWMNAACALAVRVNESFVLHGWCTQIRGVETGGRVEGLPTYTFEAEDGEWAQQCPTEVSITDRREHELSNLGVIPLVFKQNTNEAAFFGAQCLHKPPKFEDDTATANAALGARLPYIFAVSRFAHYLKQIVRDKIGTTKEEGELKNWLNSWIQNYVTDQKGLTDEERAKKPLSHATVNVVADPANPGYYRAEFKLRPHFQLEGMGISLSLVAKAQDKN